MRAALKIAAAYLVLLTACQSSVVITPQITLIPPEVSTELTEQPPLPQLVEASDPVEGFTPNSPLVTPPSTSQEIELCSPLRLHPLAELRAIISDPYRPPLPGREERHHGVDFGYYHYQDRDSMLGEPVQAVLPGTAVSVIDDLYPYGNMVIIETPFGSIPDPVREVINIERNESLYILYAHLNQAPLIQLGAQVSACQLLGEVGMSGNADIPHLHLETRLGPPATVFTSMRFYDTQASVEEMENYKLWRTSGVYRHFDPMKLLSP